jgi:two-component system chemotaxis response regulator CheY
MTELAALKSFLIEKSGLRPEQIAQAEDYALTRNISLEEALVFLELIDYSVLGKRLAAIHGKPYVALLDREPPKTAKARVSLKMAAKLRIFPVKYDSEKNVLVLAVSDPKDSSLIEKLKTLFHGTTRLAFCVASAAEIEKAIDVYYRGMSYSMSQEIHLPKDFTIIAEQEKEKEDLLRPEHVQTKEKILLLEPDRMRGGAIRSLLRAEGYGDVTWIVSAPEIGPALAKEPFHLLLVNGRLFRPKGPWLDHVGSGTALPKISYYHLVPMLLGQEYPYHEMSSALIHGVSYFVKAQLAQKPGLIKEIVNSARYGKLLASRMGLDQRQVDGIVLAAWYSGGGLGEDFLKQVPLPYGLEEFFSSEGKERSEARMEAGILSLVRRYLTLQKDDPEGTKDVQRLRKELQGTRSNSETDAMIEAFLKVIKEEELLGRVGEGAAGHILIVDPTESPVSPCALRLNNEGYQIEVVKRAKDALNKVAQGKIDLILSELNLEDAKGLQLCRAIKGKETTASTPFLFLTSDKGEGLQAECLEAGAEEFFLKPPDLDVLCLKIKRLISPKQADTKTRGVHGSISEMKPADFLQTLSAAEKDVEVRLERAKEKGAIFMQKGEVVHANTGSLSGEEAFFALMAWNDGSFEIVSCADFPARSIQSPLMSLLIEGYRRLDESQAQGEIGEDE